MKLFARTRTSRKRAPERRGSESRRRNGFSRRPLRDPILTTAEVAECTCPHFCERDHETD